ncbi:uncharacterized protein LOC130127669 isoform X2 [Lampris incognitus]|uniref:uncharacterized protein LOC130127669 isoform X2 n=1 Tax=Lampris incognitus TaxID=2546036 RepID=UPI0024B4BFD3|nr:uncharacterized protein LOC130127669 isoform X2 [Lampris incognitus]
MGKMPYSTAVTPTPPVEPKKVIVASASVVFFIVFVLVLVVRYRKDPLCCRERTAYQGRPHYTNAPTQYHRRHSLISYAYNEHSAAIQGAPGHQLAGGLFIIGKPNDYQLNGPVPRLPSYESVRKKDRQRQIHSMIAQRFGLSGSYCEDELPPTYEGTLRQSVEISPVDFQTLDLQLSIHTNTQNSQPNQNLCPVQQSSQHQGPTVSNQLTQSSNLGSLSI